MTSGLLSRAKAGMGEKAVAGWVVDVEVGTVWVEVVWVGVAGVGAVWVGAVWCGAVWDPAL